MSYRVLVVDDYMMPRTVFESVIRNSDQFTLAASLSSAQEAVTYCRNNRVDLILMDVVMMEGMNGLEASRQIKSFRPGTKIILVTSMPEVSSHSLHLKNACQAHYTPFRLAWQGAMSGQPCAKQAQHRMICRKALKIAG